MSRKKQNISYVKPEEPAFLKRIKEQIGYKENPTIDAKREIPAFDDDDDKNDEEIDKPQVVVLKEGDIGEEELAEIMKQKEKEEDKRKVEEGKITFKKPAKRSSSPGGSEETSISMTKKIKAEDSREKPKVSVKGINENRLLSFGDPDEEDD